jgi:hypothetical protein
MNSDGQQEKEKVHLRTMTRNIEPELMIDQILMLIQITEKRRLGIVIEKQQWSVMGNILCPS